MYGAAFGIMLVGTRMWRGLLLIIALLLSGSRATIAVPPSGLEPTVTQCVERLLLAAELSQAPNDTPRLQRFKEGVSILNNLERAEMDNRISLLQAALERLDEPILAVELDSILGGLMKNLPVNASNLPEMLRIYRSLERIQQSVRGHIFQALKSHEQKHSRPFVPFLENPNLPPLDDPSEVQALWDRVFKDFPSSSQNRTIEDNTVVRIAALGEAQGLEALKKSLFLLQAVLCTQQGIKHNVRWLEMNQANLQRMGVAFSPEGALEDHRRCDRYIEVTQFALARVYFRLYAIASGGGPDSDEAIGWLKYASGGDSRRILNDVEALRAGRSPFVVWMGGAIRTHHSQSVASSHILSVARAMEIQYGMVDGRPFPREATSEVLWERLKDLPPRLLSGKALPRRHGDIEQTTMQLLTALLADERTDNTEAMQAILAALYLVGDPRIDAQSLLDWVQSLYGERRSFTEEQFVRFLQEANAFLPMVTRLDETRLAMISREHRKDLSETLGPSFDLLVIETATNTVVEGTEIKQTSRPRVAGDLGGILRQATDKLDGEISILTEPNRQPPLFSFATDASGLRKLRHLNARRVLVIQFPWDRKPIEYEKGGLTFVQHPNGDVEKWRPENGKPKGRLLGSENLFVQIAKHLPKITDVDYFDEIVLSDPYGRFLVVYANLRGKSPSPDATIEGSWQIHPLNKI